MYKVIISDKARASLRAHTVFLANVSPTATNEMKKKVIAGIRSLSSMPERFPYLDDDLLPRNKYHKMVVDKRYLILYQIKDQTVYVDAIVDCRQDYGWLIDRRLIYREPVVIYGSRHIPNGLFRASMETADCTYV